MKTFFTMFCFLLFINNACAQDVKFPEGFQFDASIFKGMKLIPMNAEMKKLSLLENPSTTTDQNVIKNLTDDIIRKDIDRVYYEIYGGTNQNDQDKAGILVFEFNSEKNLAQAASKLRKQDNYIILTKDNYLIQVWIDGRDTAGKLAKAVQYYKNKINAIQYFPVKPIYKDEKLNLDRQNEIKEAAKAARDEAVAEVAPAGSFYQIGFGTFPSQLISKIEANSLQKYAEKFRANYSTEIALLAIGNYELEEDMLEGYASHLVFNFEGRIKNNIVILIDEVKYTSYFYFGTENGKIFKKLPMKAIKKKLNDHVKEGDIYKGLYETLLEFEVAIINASGQSAKMPPAKP